MKKIVFYDNKNVISSKLLELRKEQNLTQSQLAAKMQTMNTNVDQQMISKIEKNMRQVTDYELACLCICLNTTPNQILSEFLDNHN